MQIRRRLLAEHGGLADGSKHSPKAGGVDVLEGRKARVEGEGNLTMGSGIDVHDEQERLEVE